MSGPFSAHTYTLSSPRATIGIRGTDLLVRVTDTNTFVKISDNTGDACSTISGKCITLKGLSGRSSAQISDLGVVEKVQTDVADRSAQESAGAKGGVAGCTAMADTTRVA